MPSCAILTCRLRSGNVSVEKHGVSFHRFPGVPDIKEKWINATGRNDQWFPTKHSCICSKHFSEDDFFCLSKKRHLISSAVPHIDICLQSSLPRIDQSSELTVSVKQELPGEDTNEIKMRPTEQERTERELKNIISHKDAFIKKQRLKIKKLQAQNRRLKKKVVKMDEIIDGFKQDKEDKSIFIFTAP